MADKDKSRERVEIEVAVRDSFSTVLKEMGRQLAAVNRQALEIGQGPSASYNKFRRENDQLTESAKRSNAQLATMGAIFTGIGRTIIGPVGVVAGLYEAGKALDNFASGRIQIQRLSTDLHLSTSQLSIMKRTMENMGMSSEEAMRVISGAMGKIKEAFTLRGGSQLMQSLHEMGAGEWATRLQKVIDTGDFDKAMRMLIEKGNTGSARFRAHFAERVGIPESVIQSYARASEGVKAMTEADIAVLENYHKKMNKITHAIEDSWHRVAISVIDALSAMTNSKAAEFLRLPAGEALDKIKEQGSQLPNPYKLPTPNDTVKDRFGDWPSRDGTRSGITDFGGRRRDEDLVEIESDSNKLLRDIRDMMQKSEIDGGGGGGGGGAEGLGSGRQSLGRRLGIDTGSGSGTPGVSGKTKIGEGDDPRGMADYIRETAKKYNVDPETALAVAKSEGLRTFLGDNGKSGGAFQLYTGGGLGNEFQKETGLNPLDPKNEKATIDWALKNVSRTGWGPYHGAKRVGIGPRAGIDGAPGGRADSSGRVNYFQRQGMGPFDRDQMETVKTPYGNIAVHPQAAADFSGFYNDLAEAGAPIKSLGSFNKRRMRWSNQWSSHSMGAATDIDDQVQLSPKMRSWISENPTLWDETKRRYNMSQPLPRKDPAHIEWTGPRVESAREKIDKSQSQASAPPTQVDINGTFDMKNFPGWMKTAIDGGPFKKLSVTRSAPQGARAGDGIAASNPWSYE